MTLSLYSQMKDYCVAENLTWLLLQVAVMSGHFELGEIIKNHNDLDVGKFVTMQVWQKATQVHKQAESI